MDTGATADAIGKYLLGVGAGTTTGSSVAIVPAPISPVFTPESLAGLSVQGAWTTIFYPDISNGFGANIRVPAVTLNGQIIAPGQQFSFLRAVGPVDRAHGYTLGGVIKNGKSDHTGAMGGGICSASTTTFNAAARAGLRIDERHAHAYYIYRYPVGLDATVFSNGFQTYDMRFTNDTPNPIIIRAWTTRGSKSTITVQLWSKPMGRKVTFSPEFKANLTIASDKTIYTTKLAPGTKARAEYPTNGFSTSRTRTVTDATGKIIHQDTWVSHYVKVNGLLEIGVAKAPAPTPTPVVVGSGLPYTVPAAPSQAPAPRRRRTR
jgi:vancomycin resistance protein YoaR